MRTQRLATDSESGILGTAELYHVEHYCLTHGSSDTETPPSWLLPVCVVISSIPWTSFPILAVDEATSPVDPIDRTKLVRSGTALT